ncbi:hypothetical protein RYH80_07450 [Halobaculum sp. MBLA0147]|uniref:hypothetical protein n=1 Tax=Halobaculum sp. MBLA0147 TaxID=3079934 RepID=UPI0035248190
MRTRGATRVAVVVPVCWLLVGVAGAHQFVAFQSPPAPTTSGDAVAVDANLHRVDAATLRVAGPEAFELVVRFADDEDGRVRLRLDTAAVADGRDTPPVTAESGRVTGVETTAAPDGPLPPGEYDLSLSIPRGVGDRVTLAVRAAPTDAGTTTEARSRTESGDATAGAARADTSSATEAGVSPPLVLLALLAPGAVVAALAVASRVVGE